MNNILIGVLVLGLLFGGFAGTKISNLNPFKSSKVVEKSEGYKEEIYNDRIKGIEYRLEEKFKNQKPSNSSESIGSRIGRFIDNSFKLIIGFIIFGVVLLFLTGFNIFKWIKKLIEKLKLTQRALKQTSEGVQKAKQFMNGEKKTLLDALEKSQDEDVKKFLRQFKDENNIK